MPTFRWKGQNRSGALVQGEIAADSANDVIARLRHAGIGVIELSAGKEGELPAFGAAERAAARMPPTPTALPKPSLAERIAEARARSGGSRPFRGAMIAAGLVLGALAIGIIAPITVCRCERTANGAVDCTISERDLGLITIREQSLSGVTSVDVESKAYNERIDNDRNRIGWRENLRLVLGNASGATIRPSTWEQRSQRVRTSTGGTSGGEQWIGASTEMMRDTIAKFLAQSTGARASTWQGQTVPLAFPGVLLAFSVLVLGLTVIGLFSGPTNLLYAMLGRAAEALDKRQRQQQP
jgi:hypothetical protein